jgi:8-oxo-dGTP pyrophosphatase MutT (NUDIX family)
MHVETTSTVYIFAEQGVLLLFHRKQRKWMPPGGHLEANELPHAGALREALEETGLDIELIKDHEHLWVEYPHAQSLPRPYQCLLETIPAVNGSPAHYHLDWIFVGHPCGGSQNINLVESTQLRWFTAAEIAALPENDIYPEVRAFALQLLANSHYQFQRP